MFGYRAKTGFQRSAGLLRRLARDRSGNTLALLAAGILPLLGLVGGGIDMGRSYLAESRLQQACDAGVLAARKRLGTGVAATGVVPSDVAEFGQRFFDVNFRDGNYGTANRNFQMALERDYSISGAASVDVPTTVMNIFGFDKVAISVSCASQLHFPSVDLMMVLDVTGSMRHTNAGDSMSRIDSLKQVIRDFHKQLEATKQPGTSIRYGFVPYATNVNVGHLLKNEWVETTWTYQSREETDKILPSIEKNIYKRNIQYESGTKSDWITESSYDATFTPSSNADQLGTYSCDEKTPKGTYDVDIDETGKTTKEVQLDPNAILHITPIRETEDGTRYRTILSGTTCEVQTSEYDNYIETYEEVREVPSFDRVVYAYHPIEFDMASWRSDTAGCIEERASTEIDDFSNVDLSQNLDLNIDLVPTNDSDTKWKPQNSAGIFVRKIKTDGSGKISTKAVQTGEEYANTGMWWFSDCPAKAQKLAQMSEDDIDNYLATLAPYGATYHDIGMIWGGRLLSPTGLFAAENTPSGGGVANRNLIFLTDGQTEPYDLSYGAYGVDALDQRRWDPKKSKETLKEVVEARFAIACNEVKKRNITVWVIAFGTFANDAMVECAGNGRYFEAANAVELNKAFSSIAQSLGDLRISR